jgi:hypothetical protein
MGKSMPLGAAALLVLGALSLVSPASSKLERDTKPADSAGPAPDTGGHHVLPSAPFRLECSQFGHTIIAGQGLEHLRVAFPLVGWLSFQRPGRGGQEMVLPLGDGVTTCVVSREGAPR